MGLRDRRNIIEKRDSGVSSEKQLAKIILFMIGLIFAFYILSGVHYMMLYLVLLIVAVMVILFIIFGKEEEGEEVKLGELVDNKYEYPTLQKYRSRIIKKCFECGYEGEIMIRKVKCGEYSFRYENGDYYIELGFCSRCGDFLGDPEEVVKI